MDARRGVGATPLMAALGLATLVVLLASFGARLWWFGEAAPLPELLQNLGDSGDDALQQAFIPRLNQKFPQGSDEKTLEKELRREGFKIRDDVQPPQGEASYDRAAGLNDLCRRGGTVKWTAEEGKLRMVTGGFYAHCPSRS